MKAGSASTVFIDPGHGGPDPGAFGSTTSGTAVSEKGPTLAIGQRLRALLQHAGYAVVMSRTGDTGVAKISADDLFGNGYSIDGDGEDIRARVACANAVAASVLVSIHLDAFSDPSVGGAETIYSAARPFAQMSRRLGELVQRDIMAAYRGRGWSIPDRGVQNDFGQGARGLSPQGRAYHHLLVLGPASPPWFVHPSAMPGVMVEPLFITDPSEADLAATAKGQSAIALGLAHAIETYLASNTAGGGG